MVNMKNKFKHDSHNLINLVILLSVFYVMTLFSLIKSEQHADMLSEQNNRLQVELGQKIGVEFYRVKKIDISDEEEYHLALNIFHEAGIENYAGKIGVAQVTYNRLVSGNWGNNIKKVVHSPSQFSWTLKKVDPPSGALWTESRNAARDFVNGVRIRELDGATHYHADFSDMPKWAFTNVPVVRIGRHIFYEGV